MLGSVEEAKSQALVYEADFSEEQSRQYTTPERQASKAPDASDRMALREQLENMLSQLDKRTGQCSC